MADSRSGSDKPIYVLDESLRGRFSAPLGAVLKSGKEIADAIAGSAFVVSVGDVVTLDLLEMGITPDISIVDYATKRIPIDEVRKRFSRYPQEEVPVKNPPGTITKGLWEAIADGYRNPRHLRIVVDGEEDLAALACIALAPGNTSVIYGIPNRGASVHRVDEELKRKVDEALDRMRA